MSRAGWAFCALAMWLVTRPYFGIIHDSPIYLGRVLADADPGGLGRDLVFSHDGQSGFTVFGLILAPAVRLWGAEGAMMGISFIGLLAWFACAAALFSRVLRGPALLAALVGLALIDTDYGGYGVFGVGEQFATPRVFAEAASMLALAAALDRRWISSALVLAAAGLLHPLMAAPAAAVWFLMLAQADRRLLALPVIGVIVLLAGATLGLPVAERLFTVVDADWLRVMERRVPYLFPSLWRSGDFASLAFQVTAVTLAASVATDRWRTLLLASIIVVVAGFVVSIAMPTLLVVQLQFWRAQWLVATLAAGATPWLAAKLSKGDGRESAVAGFIIAALLVQDQPLVCGALCVAALVTRFVQRPAGGGLLKTAAWTLAGCGLAWTFVVHGAVLIKRASSSDYSLADLRFDLVAIVSPLVIVLMIALLRRMPKPWPRRIRWASVAVGALALPIGVAAWDARTGFEQALEAKRGALQLQAKLPQGDVLWLDRPEFLYLLTARPAWWSHLQGAPSVFNRDLALESGRRQEVLARAGVAWTPAPFGEQTPQPQEQFDARAFKAICSDQRPPVAVVAGLSRVARSLRQSADAVWSPSVPRGRDYGEGDRRFLIFRCDSENPALVNRSVASGA